MSSAMVVLSGGQDSMVCLAWACQEFDEVHAVTFFYGQRHSREIECARALALKYGVKSHEIVQLPGDILQGTSPLTDHSVALEQYESFDEMTKIIGSRVEKTFVPMRNALFLTLAANRAVCKGIVELVTGVCEADTQNYPDCTRAFISLQEATIAEALDLDEFTIHAPLLQLNKCQTVLWAVELGCYEDFALTHTAYDGSYPPTGADHATVARAQGFLEAGLPDPLIIRAYEEGLLQSLPATSNYDGARA